MVSFESAQKLVDLAENEESSIILYDVAWKTYEELLEERDRKGRRSPSFAYNRGKLLIDVKSRPEESVSFDFLNEAVQTAIKENAAMMLHFVAYDGCKKLFEIYKDEKICLFNDEKERLLIVPKFDTERYKCKISNDKENPLTLWLEPWGEDYTLLKNDTFEIEAESFDNQCNFHFVQIDNGLQIYVEGFYEMKGVFQNTKLLKCGHNRIL